MIFCREPMVYPWMTHHFENGSHHFEDVLYHPVEGLARDGDLYSKHWMKYGKE